MYESVDSQALEIEKLIKLQNCFYFSIFHTYDIYMIPYRNLEIVMENMSILLKNRGFNTSFSPSPRFEFDIRSKNQPYKLLH